MPKPESLTIKITQDVDQFAAMLDWLADTIDWESETDYWGQRLHRLISRPMNEQLSARSRPPGP